MQNKHCYLCRNDQLIKKIGSVRDNSKLSLLECNECSLVFLSSFDHISDDLYEDGIMHNDDIGDGRALEIDEMTHDDINYSTLQPLIDIKTEQSRMTLFNFLGIL